MVEQNTKIVNPTGMHTIAAVNFISFLHIFSNCDVTIIKDGQSANAKSILSLIMLELNQGDEITLRVSGKNEDNVIKQIIHYIEDMNE